MEVLKQINITILKATLRNSDLKYANDALVYINELESKLDGSKNIDKIKSKFKK